MTNSAGPPGVSHPRPCPEVLRVPCAPCLRLLLTADPTEPHDCTLGTALAIDGERLVLAPADGCPCQEQEESEALRAARAKARGLPVPARQLTERSCTE